MHNGGGGAGGMHERSKGRNRDYAIAAEPGILTTIRDLAPP